MDESRYGRASRWKVLALGLPPAIFMIALGGYWTLQSWGVVEDSGGSRTASAVGSILAGFGVALAYVCIRRRP